MMSNQEHRDEYERMLRLGAPRLSYPFVGPNESPIDQYDTDVCPRCDAASVTVAHLMGPDCPTCWDRGFVSRDVARQYLAWRRQHEEEMEDKYPIRP